MTNSITYSINNIDHSILPGRVLEGGLVAGTGPVGTGVEDLWKENAREKGIDSGNVRERGNESVKENERGKESGEGGSHHLDEGLIFLKLKLRFIFRPCF